MEARARSLAVLLLAALPLALLGVSHVLYVHLARSGFMPTFEPAHHPEALPLVVIGAGLLVPLAAIGVAARRWWRVEAEVHALHHAAPVTYIEGESVSVLATPRVQVFAAGVRAPAIFASAGALGAMQPPELRAAVLHERSHIMSHDTRFRPVLSGLRLALGWVPPIRAAISQLIIREECRADTLAVQAGASPAELAGAILAVNGAALGGGASLGDGQVLLRLERLAEPTVDLPGSPGRTLLVACLCVLSIPLTAHLALLMGL